MRRVWCVGCGLRLLRVGCCMSRVALRVLNACNPQCLTGHAPHLQRLPPAQPEWCRERKKGAQPRLKRLKWFVPCVVCCVLCAMRARCVLCVLVGCVVHCVLYVCCVLCVVCCVCVLCVVCCVCCVLYVRFIRLRRLRRLSAFAEERLPAVSRRLRRLSAGSAAHKMTATAMFAPSPKSDYRRLSAGDYAGCQPDGHLIERCQRGLPTAAAG